MKVAPFTCVTDGGAVVVALPDDALATARVARWAEMLGCSKLRQAGALLLIVEPAAGGLFYGVVNSAAVSGPLSNAVKRGQHRTVESIDSFALENGLEVPLARVDDAASAQQAWTRLIATAGSAASEAAAHEQLLRATYARDVAAATSARPMDPRRHVSVPTREPRSLLNPAEKSVGKRKGIRVGQ
jgi:hypothetical protein